MTINATSKSTKKTSKFIIRLQVGENAIKTYRLKENLFNEIEKMIQPYRSIGSKAKPVRCIETGEVFPSAKKAADWLYNIKLTSSYSADVQIKDACKGKKQKAYGYHWEFVK